ncbi:SIMPL domain-containing protein [uncultured Sunxiuqinia sp.]|uniref:SIMPL domain-containing protein n=1 Tax=uncultured Sunxiuqinia sp. TaxID=1573825 RepID=UPI00260440E7|nr:SIMPL domain-containing protein [uncultured Sunxiuqinia sp.]
MKTSRLILILLVFSLSGFAQTELNPLVSTPYIEVTGEGEMEVVPDEIFLQFTLKERYEGKTKINIEDLEKKLKQHLKVNKFDLSKLSLANADADFVTIKRKNKDMLASKNYLLEVGSTSELANVWEILDEIDAQNAHIQRVDHSQMDDFKKEVKIKAIKDAREKASYLLEAVDQKLGKVLFIQERANFIQPYAKNILIRGTASMMNESSIESEPEISFEKMKLSYKVFTRFAIGE